LFVEASAKSGQNVQLAFEQASRDILDKIRRGVFEDDRVRTLDPNPETSLMFYLSAVTRRQAFETRGQFTGFGTIPDPVFMLLIELFLPRIM
jgi:hypothetical protein